MRSPKTHFSWLSPRGALFAMGSLLIAPSMADTVTQSVKIYGTHQTAPTLYVGENGARLAYRRFGKAGGIPVLFLQHYAGNMDNWDPKLTDGIARDREVILFDNAGVASSEGSVPATIEGMARVGIDLLSKLGVHQVDLLGFSTGSLIAQDMAIMRPDLVRRLVLVGTSPRGGVGMASLTPEFQGFLDKKRDVPDELLLDALFTQSSSGQAAGRAFLTRIRARVVDRDVEVSGSAADAQRAALAVWGAPASDSNSYLLKITQPVLVVDGNHDVVFYTINAIRLTQELPNALLMIYPDSNHGPQYRHPDLFLKHVTTFLTQPDE